MPTAVTVIVLLSLLSPMCARGQSIIVTERLPGELETELALSALPPHLRNDAGVYHLFEDGYETVREPRGEFMCLVRRNGAIPGTFGDSIAPVCYDREGTRTLLPAVLDEVEMVQTGVPPDTVRSRIAARWASGVYERPGPGVSYMLSPVFRLNGRNDAFVPHIMFYGPGKTDHDIGATGDRLDHVPFVQAPGLPSAMMVIPVGSDERGLIRDRESDLVDRVQRYIDAQDP